MAGTCCSQLQVALPHWEQGLKDLAELELAVQVVFIQLVMAPAAPCYHHTHDYGRRIQLVVHLVPLPNQEAASDVL